ncbi:hypothetical protein BMS3Bbin06_01489 [bacterium BMS3Bbin06]|nr:hypothetical protein BMS3Bbin06_01489 [bacterium BMS3Bbin06]
MKATVEKVNPEEYILSVLSPEDRLNAAFNIAREAFKKSKLTIKDIEDAVKSIRRKAQKDNLSGIRFYFRQ